MWQNFLSARKKQRHDVNLCRALICLKERRGIVVPLPESHQVENQCDIQLDFIVPRQFTLASTMMKKSECEMTAASESCRGRSVTFEKHISQTNPCRHLCKEKKGSLFTTIVILLPVDHGIAVMIRK